MSLPEYADPIIVEVGLLGTIGTSADDRTSVVPYNGQLDGSGIFVTSVYNSMLCARDLPLADAAVRNGDRSKTMSHRAENTRCLV